MKKTITSLVLLSALSLNSNSVVAAPVDCELHGFGDLGFAWAESLDPNVMKMACFVTYGESDTSKSVAHKVAHGLSAEDIESNSINPTIPECFTGHVKDLGFAGGN